MILENEYLTTCSNEVLFPSLVSFLEINNQYHHVQIGVISLLFWAEILHKYIGDQS